MKTSSVLYNPSQNSDVNSEAHFGLIYVQRPHGSSHHDYFYNVLFMSTNLRYKHSTEHKRLIKLPLFRRGDTCLQFVNAFNSL